MPYLKRHFLFNKSMEEKQLKKKKSTNPIKIFSALLTLGGIILGLFWLTLGLMITGIGLVLFYYLEVSEKNDK